MHPVCSRGCKKVFLSASFSRFSKEQVLGKTVDEEAETTPLWQETCLDRCSSLSNCSLVSNINKLHNWTNIYTYFTLTHIHFYCKANRILLLVEIFLSPPNVLRNAQSAKGAEPTENPLFPEHTQCSWGQHNFFSHGALWRCFIKAKGGRRNLHWYCDGYSYKQRASKSVGMSPWQLSTVLKFSPKELWQWKFLGEKRIKENSWLELIDTKSLQYKERWTIELLTEKGMSGKEKRELYLIPIGLLLPADNFVLPVWIRVSQIFRGPG